MGLVTGKVSVRNFCEKDKWVNLETAMIVCTSDVRIWLGSTRWDFGGHLLDICWISADICHTRAATRLSELGQEFQNLWEFWTRSSRSNPILPAARSTERLDGGAPEPGAGIRNLRLSLLVHCNRPPWYWKPNLRGNDLWNWETHSGSYLFCTALLSHAISDMISNTVWEIRSPESVYIAGTVTPGRHFWTHFSRKDASTFHNDNQIKRENHVYRHHRKS